MNINFKQPKYIIPIIAFPFILLFFYVFSSWGGSSKPKLTAQDSAAIIKGYSGLNTDMPNVSKQIDTQNVKDKFKAYQDAYKNNKDFSALNGLNETEMQSSLDNLQANQSNYSPEEIRKLRANKSMDSLNKILHVGQANIDNRLEQILKGNSNNSSQRRTASNSNGGGYDSYNRRSSNSSQNDPVLAALDRINKTNDRPQQNNNKDSYQEQMKIFKEQMQYVDSIQKNQHGNTSIKNNNENKPTKDTSFKPLPVSTFKGTKNNSFNSITKIDHNEAIKAIIDEEIKVRLGSRIRIRLLTDIYAGNEFVPKGTYIYGVITGFQTQRVNVTIQQIQLNNTTLPVKMDVFDNDGYLGLYVPGSNFREFTKEIGTQASQGVSSIQSASDQSIVTGMVNKLFSTTTTTISKLIAKDKAVLKYNYIIYLNERK